MQHMSIYYPQEKKVICTTFNFKIQYRSPIAGWYLSWDFATENSFIHKNCKNLPLHSNQSDSNPDTFVVNSSICLSSQGCGHGPLQGHQFNYHFLTPVSSTLPLLLFQHILPPTLGTLSPPFLLNTASPQVLGSSLKTSSYRSQPSSPLPISMDLGSTLQD